LESVSTLRDRIFRPFSLALFFLLAAKLPAQQPPVQLLLPSRTLDPKSTFELRFASEMVSPNQSAGPRPYRHWFSSRRLRDNSSG